MGRRILSGLTALLLALALLPAGARADDTSKLDCEVETLAELKAYIELFKNGTAPRNYVQYSGADPFTISESITFPEGLSFSSSATVSIWNGASVVMEGKTDSFAVRALRNH